MSKKPLTSSDFSASTRIALQRAGYETIDDLSGTSPEALSKELGITIEDSQAVFSASQRPTAPPKSQSVAFMTVRPKCISSNNLVIDKLLGGGIPRGHILEISGPPGCIKESLALDFVRSFVECGEEVIFVDMQNMISPAAIDNVFKNSPAVPSHYQDLIRYTHLHTLPELMMFIHNLLSELKPKTGLLVLNSIQFPFQSHPNLQPSKRTTLLEDIRQVLLQASASKNLSIIATSQMSTKMLNADGSPANFETGAKAVMVPYLASAYLPVGRSFRVLVVPSSRSTGVLRLLSSPTYRSGQGSAPREEYDLTK
ncbi:hypothetical protein BJ138DRAFT_1158770 [Hygrophoropsis aurantiaca]|uniref:Uncharacterized protein n=1 Tax=Hygrophoropsis aurantiaca TaxID=72124 RepID=A0ACB8A5K5_9AGAM|nr:hypothetical protein BJ138DRAFT_1158770 [Hygrophoropsis aurantiaca]